ncbi:MAG: hypothetical protein GKS06_07670 [Acidobacteria bacterium]|nr:hypothetical protein [Acidobacteriota bacterium]
MSETIRWPEEKRGVKTRLPCIVCGRPLRDYDEGNQCRSCVIACMSLAPEPKSREKRSGPGSWLFNALEAVGELLDPILFWMR